MLSLRQLEQLTTGLETNPTSLLLHHIDMKLLCPSYFNPSYLKRWIGAVRGISSSALHKDDVIGIDFGTINSHVAVLEGEVPTIVESEYGRAIPSFVAVSNDGNLVGPIAKEYLMAFARNTLFKVKDLIGKRYDDPHTQQLKNMVPYKIAEGSKGEALIEVGTRQLSPTQVCAFILCEMKEAAERHLMRMVSKAVITVPVHFDGVQRQEMEVAGRTAGLDVLKIIDEPIAATMSCRKSLDDGCVAILDMGGGAFSVSIVGISNGDMKVLAHRGDPFLGGEDFDHAFVKYLVDELKETHSMDVSDDPVAMVRLMEAAEDVKVQLSSSHHAEVCIPYLAGTGSSPLHVNMTVTRAKFEVVVQHLIERVRTICEKCLKEFAQENNCLQDAGNSIGVEKVLLVGGMARVPWVQQIVGETFVKAPWLEKESDQSVALGAAIHGGFIIEDTREPQWNVIPLSVGVEILGGIFLRVINRNNRIPTTASCTFSTEVKYQDRVCIRILHGERELAAHNKLLGELEVTGISPAPQGVPRIIVTFNFDAVGDLFVSAEIENTGMKQTIRVPYSIKQAQECARKMVKEAMLHGYSEKEEAALIRCRTTAQLVADRLEVLLEVKKKEITSHRAISSAEAALHDLRVAMASTNVVALKSKVFQAQDAGTGLFNYEMRKISRCGS